MTALVTGASSGIGAAFADRLAANGHDVVGVARGQRGLDVMAAAVRREHGVVVQTMTADLATRAGQDRVSRRLSAPTGAERPIDVLVNNAGGALPLDFADSDPHALRALMELNMASVQELMRAALAGMLERGHGVVLNVASMNAYLDLPGGAATYGASKAYVTALSKGIAVSLAGTGVRVMALCPGPTSTPFHERTATAGPTALRWLAHTPTWVVDRALIDLRRGRIVSVPGISTKAMITLGHYVPARLTARAVRHVRARRHHDDQAH